MAPLQRGWRALALALAACAAGPAVQPARGQGLAEERLVYEKWLDLSLNPARSGEAAVALPAAPVPDEPLSGELLSLPALVDDAERGTRVINGHRAQKGAWPSAVNLAIVKDGVGQGTCGGTIIGKRWVLTSAHCVFRRREGGVSLMRTATVYAKSGLRFEPGSTLPYAGEVLRARRVVVHTEFARTPGLLNDIALLELEGEATAERQTLAAQAGAATFLAPGNIATVVGWGVTTPVPAGTRPGLDPARFPHSKHLVQADLPIASPQSCGAFLRRPARPAEFCAGDGTGSADTCNGDSGGPLFVGGPAGEVIQAGIVSWGPGCAQPETYGVYTSVGHFEQWIRKYVPDAQFVAPQDAASALAAISGARPNGPPAPHGQVTVDLAVVDCTRASVPYKAGSRSVNAGGTGIKVGSCIRVQVTSGVSGHLGVFSRNARGDVEQIFPNQFSGSNQAGATPSSVRAGQVVMVPGPADGIDLKVSTPLGPAEIVAVVVAEAVGLPETTRPYRGAMRSVASFKDELAAVAQRVNAVPSARRAVGTRQYEVVE
jgi:secreted trypsin-like serine protease